ncbi:MAG TPA: NDP-sugar synthase [Blastocatellia bacterium]|nr:NDP-sugar synthase [Blastocatellia bacterium]
MKAMILAAGFGTRLWPLTIGRTKPAIPLLNRPLIAYTLDYLRRYGFKEVIINLHHEPDSVRQQLGDGSDYGVRIDYSLEEPEILGTSGALDRVRERLDRETFVVINGKIVTELDLGAALETHRKQQALATLVLRPNSAFEHFREVAVSADGRVTGFADYPTGHPTGHPHSPSAPLMFTGIHVLEPGIFDYIPRGVFSDSVKDVYPRAMAEGRRIGAHVGAGAWYELSTLERYLAINLELARGSGSADSRGIWGEGCRIEEGAQVENSVLWKRVRVESGARLSECVVGDDVVIPAGAEFRRMVIVPRGLAGPEPSQKVLSGEVIGENLVVPIG